MLLTSSCLCCLVLAGGALCKECSRRWMIEVGSGEHGHYTQPQLGGGGVPILSLLRPPCALRGLEAGVYLPIGVCRSELMVGKARDGQRPSCQVPNEVATRYPHRALEQMRRSSFLYNRPAHALVMPSRFAVSGAPVSRLARPLSPLAISDACFKTTIFFRASTGWPKPMWHACKI